MKKFLIVVLLIALTACANTKVEVNETVINEITNLDILCKLQDYIKIQGPNNYASVAIDIENINGLCLYSDQELKIVCEVKYNNPEIIVYKNDEIVAMSYLEYRREGIGSNDEVVINITDSVNKYLEEYSLHIDSFSFIVGELPEVLCEDNLPDNFKQYVDMYLEELSEENSDYAMKNIYTLLSKIKIANNKLGERLLILETQKIDKRVEIGRYSNTGSRNLEFVVLNSPYIDDGLLACVNYQIIPLNKELYGDDFTFDFSDYYSLILDIEGELVEVYR